MELNYTDGSLLSYWYDTWIVAVGFSVALVLAVLVVARANWKTDGLLLKLAVVVAAVAAWPLTGMRIGIGFSGDKEVLGYLSLVGVIAAIVVGVPYLYLTTRRSRVMGAKLGADATPPEGVTISEQGGGVTAMGEQGTATLGGGATLTLGAVTPIPSGALTQAPGAWLLFKSGPRAGQSIPIQPGATSIGRAQDNDVVIDDAAVSRLHARISYQDGQYFVEDAGSVGGTMVEGMTASRTVLASGASLRLGETELVFMQAEATSVGGVPAATGTGRQSPAETMVMEQKEGLMAWLAVTTGPDKGKTYQLKAGDNTIGRDSENDMAIQDPAISRRHAMIKAQDGEFLLLDLGSRGGTGVKGETLEGKSLKTGGVISVGQTRLGLVEVEAHQQPQQATISGQTIIDQPGAPGGVIIVQSGPDAGKSFTLTQGDNVIGRESDCSILLSDDTVSRRHAIVRCEQDRVVVFDLGSRTGTQVDGEAIRGYLLSPGDTVSLGRTEIALMQPQKS